MNSLYNMYVYDFERWRERQLRDLYVELHHVEAVGGDLDLIDSIEREIRDMRELTYEDYIGDMRRAQ